MTSYQRTRTVTRTGLYAFRARDGQWYIVSERFGGWTGQKAATRREAYAMTTGR